VARPVVWAARARADLRLAVEYISRDSLQAAVRFGEAVVELTRSLADMPERGRVVPELGDPQVREVLLARQRVVYEIFPEKIGVVPIIHTSRDFLRAWGRG
jgi:toxin ParE1/3/4